MEHNSNPNGEKSADVKRRSTYAEDDIRRWNSNTMAPTLNVASLMIDLHKVDENTFLTRWADDEFEPDSDMVSLQLVTRGRSLRPDLLGVLEHHDVVIEFLSTNGSTCTWQMAVPHVSN